MASTKVTFNWEDPFLLEAQLTEEERMIQKVAHDYCQSKLQPRVLEQFRHEKPTKAYFVRWASLGYWVLPSANNTAARG